MIRRKVQRLLVFAGICAVTAAGCGVQKRAENGEAAYGDAVEVENTADDGVVQIMGTVKQELEPWQEAYLSYLRQDSHTEDYIGYQLIYLDDDEIPELVEIGFCEEKGARIVNYSEGKACVTQLTGREFTYIEKENLLCDTGMYYYRYDRVYRIVDGELTVTQQGYYGCEWNGEKVDQEEYADKLEQAYDFAKARPGYATGKYLSAGKMIKLLSEPWAKGEDNVYRGEKDNGKAASESAGGIAGQDHKSQTVSMTDTGYGVRGSVLEETEENEEELPLLVWAETIEQGGVLYRVSFERNSLLYKKPNTLCGLMADYSLTVKDMAGDVVSRLQFINQPVTYEEAYWIEDISGDGYEDLVFCIRDERVDLSEQVSLRFFVWEENEERFCTVDSMFVVNDPVWNGEESALMVKGQNTAYTEYKGNAMYRFTDWEEQGVWYWKKIETFESSENEEAGEWYDDDPQNRRFYLSSREWKMETFTIDRPRGLGKSTYQKYVRVASGK